MNLNLNFKISELIKAIQKHITKLPKPKPK